MNGLSDQQLLRDYATHRSEAAFAELVRRHTDMVYSAALRMVRDANTAKDVTQGAFLALAQNARQLASRPVLSGWLHVTAQNLAGKVVRCDVRRRAREQEAAAMNQLLATERNPIWEEISTHLDAALRDLSEPDRDALMLRYFEQRSAEEMARVLGITAEAAQKRVTRAIERLRGCFARRGVTVGASTLAAFISANAVQAAPAGLAVTISAALLANTISPAAVVALTTKTIAMTTLQKTLVTATVTILAGATLYESREVARLREQNQTLQQQQTLLMEKIEHLEVDARGKLFNARLNSPPPFRSVHNEQPSNEDRQPTNIFARLMNEIPKLTRDQVEPYLKANSRNAESLLAAFRATDDRQFLFEAMERFPEDARVCFMAYFRSEPSNLKEPATVQRRQWLESLQHADSDNALPDYLSAREYFSSGKPELALEELQAAASKTVLRDFTFDLIQNTEEAFLAAGYSEVEAKAIASSDIRLRHFTELRFLGSDLNQLADAYRQTGDSRSAQTVLELALHLGRQLDQSRAFSIAQTAIAIEIQRNAILAMDADQTDPNLLRYLEILNRRREENRASQQVIDGVLAVLSEQELLSYLNRTLLFGEEAAREWALSRRQNDVR